MSEVAFTGERLHEGSRLFGVDLARHRAAYEFAEQWPGEGETLDLGCGSGYGTAFLSGSRPRVLGVDRIRPDRASRESEARFVRADLRGIPFASESFDLVVSFQVIEHLVDPNPYLREIARLMRPGGAAILTTPNLLTSDGENPFHVHEYEAGELTELLAEHFGEVEMRGIGASPAAAEYLEARLRRIRRITRLDPLRLRDRIPRPLVEWLFGQLALVVRRGVERDGALTSVTTRDFPIGAADRDCVDLLAICRNPLAQHPE